MVRLIGTTLALILAVGAAAGQPPTDLLTLESGSSLCRLSQQGVVDGSEWVYIGLSRAVRGLDYTIDYKTGTITTTKPVSSRTPVRVDYSYSPELIAGASLGALMSPGTPGLALVPVYHSGRTDAILGQQSSSSTYGVNSLINLGADSTLSGAWYMSGAPRFQAAHSESLVLPSPNRPVKDGNLGSLIAQNADIGVGAARLRVGYESVGQSFQESASSSGVSQAIAKEKGIKRIDMAGSLPVVLGNLNFSANKVLDHRGEISSRILGFSTGGFALSYGVREVTRGFTGFGRIREADASQMAAEAGLGRSLLGARYARSGVGAASVSFSKLSGEGGGIDSTVASLEAGPFRFTYDSRSGNAGFRRTDALNDQERGAMALAVKRQFNRGACEKDITPQDKGQFNGEGRLNRTNYLLEWRRPGLGAWFGSSSVTNAIDGLERTWLGLQGKTFALDWTRQRVGSSFDRLGSLQPVERAAYGNERGMVRNSFSGSATLKTATVAFAGTSVFDGSADVTRGSLQVKASGLSFHAGFRDISPAFTRVLDLADPDRQDLLGYVGFKRSDYELNLSPNKILAIHSFADVAANYTDGRSRTHRLNEVSYCPTKGPNVKILSDYRRDVNTDGSVVGASHDRLEVSHRLNAVGGSSIQIVSDSRSSMDVVTGEHSSRFVTMHLESLAGKDTSVVLDTVDAGSSDGQKETVRSLGFQAKPGGRVSVSGLMQTVGSATGKSGAFGAIALNWAINKDLKLQFNVENVGRGASAGRRNRQFSLNGLLLKRLLWLNNITIAGGLNTASKDGQQVGCDNTFRMEAGLLGGSIAYSSGDRLDSSGGHVRRTSRLFTYKSDTSASRPFHFAGSIRRDATLAGESVTRREFSADARLWRGGSITYTGCTGGKVTAAGAIPASACDIKINHGIADKTNLMTHYVSRVNGVEKRRSRSLGLGVSGKLANGEYEFEVGRAMIDDGSTCNSGSELRIKYDRRISEGNYITLSATKTVRPAKLSPNDTSSGSSARIDLRMEF